MGDLEVNMSDLDDNIVDHPSQQEQEGYYYGLPSQPKLVARSNTDSWQFQQDQWPIGKVLDLVGKHKIVGLWNDSTGPLRRDILAAVASLNWTALDILRIGYQRDNEFTGQSFEHPVTLLISVEKDSTSWSVGYATVMRCHQLLLQYGIDDVHVEMKESSITLLMPDTPASPAPSVPPIVPKLSAAALKEPLDLNSLLSEYLGQCIASSDRAAEGTKCLYLRDMSNGKILALTCRHVVLSNENPNTEYQYDNIIPRHTILQPGNETLAKEMLHLTYAIQDLDKIIERVDRNPSLTRREKERRIARNADSKAILQQQERTLRQLEAPSTRVIGHLLFSPMFGMGTTKRGAQRLRDWALIELHQEKHSTDLNMLQNRVVAPDWLGRKLAKVAVAEFNESNCYLEFDGTNTVPLLGTISEREMYNKRLQEVSSTLDASAIMVLKYGRSTGLTMGLASRVKSVLRFPHRDIAGRLSEEWCILGHKADVDRRRGPFSGPGDSGACVWDAQGRIGGMITAGLGSSVTREQDTTYATPMEWLLEDIKTHGFNVELLGS